MSVPPFSESGTFDAQRTRLTLEGRDVLLIDTFGARFSDSDLAALEPLARALYEACIAANPHVALIQMGPEMNARPVHV